MHNKTILLIDDDHVILNLMKEIFVRAGGEVHTAMSGSEGLRLLYAVQPDLVILDVMMPEMDGFEVCRDIRKLCDVPVIMLTSLSAEEDIIRGLDSGADDFITKPFNTGVLLARARAALRRGGKADEPLKSVLYSDDYLLVDHEKRLVLVEGNPVRLSPTEYNLLIHLLENSGRVCTFSQILEHVWGWEYRDNIDYVHVYVSHLRSKIELDPKLPTYVQTEHGIGYRFEKKRL